MAKTLVIVESPTKASKIASFLGDGYVVESSRGHVRDLPTGASEVPAKFKGEAWARTGVNVDNNFEPLYVVAADKKSTIRALKDHLKDADELLLATDGDREGEAIAWHLLQELKPKVPAKRMVFHEITPSAIQEAVSSPRELDVDLVDAQETRRILDRLYGYEVSPVLWKKVKPRLSAGRVQSVATRLVVDRERERMAFVAASYWDLDATFDSGRSGADEVRRFPGRLVSLDGTRIAQGRDFTSRGQLRGEAVALDEPAARSLADGLTGADFTVTAVESKPYTRRPYPPFRTTTLQQDAGRRLGFSAEHTMRIAQQLYEGGFITYMRTDSVTLSSTAITAARAQATQLYGADAVPARPRVYTSKVKNAQEAHEAIRPAGEEFRTPAQTGLRADQFRLYELIWQRTVASQMVDATGQSVTVRIEGRPSSAVAISQLTEPVRTAQFTSSGRTITNPGFLRAYVQGVEEDESSDDAQTRLPQLAEGQSLTAVELTPEGHSTKPPARYTEPTLVAKLEELEIGRPSTYASIIRTITSRDYVFKRGSALVPTWLAFAVTRLLEGRFADLVDYQFTADMEDTLDEIARGEAKRIDVLKDFYFGDADGSSSDTETGHEGLHRLVTELGEIDARDLSTFPLTDLETEGADGSVVVRVGRYGTYVEDAAGNRANVEDDLPPDELTVDKARELLASNQGDGRELGLDPLTHNPIVAKAGRYGPYVTEVLDEDAPKGAKPRTGSLFASMSLETVTLEQALMLMSLPRVVGTDAEGVEITAQNGRYGPYLRRGTDSRSLTSEQQILDITLDEALAIYAQPKTRGRAAAAGPLKELGPDPVSGKTIQVKDGRFGPYVTDGEVNATLRRTDSVDDITPERAAELLAEKRAKGPAPKRATTRRTSTAKKAPAKKASTAKASTAKAGTAKKPPSTTARTVKATRSGTGSRTSKG
ncbi:type I DNA topoisomerase [Aestuariimicrobium ganziense]|uniref:type I DNA topoisomerase n=1 Tax=Aestuariimicrobium ganziense TaxID=2773677 RepID=UPI0019416B0C|nr:type I DNA topoisomerase [Aestuariimicrobium ganziense]